MQSDFGVIWEDLENISLCAPSQRLERYFSHRICERLAPLGIMEDQLRGSSLGPSVQYCCKVLRGFMGAHDWVTCRQPLGRLYIRTRFINPFKSKKEYDRSDCFHFILWTKQNSVWFINYGPNWIHFGSQSKKEKSQDTQSYLFEFERI